MGLPLAAVYADVTGHTVGVDIDPERAATVARGENPFPGEPGLGELLDDLVDSDAFKTTTDAVRAAEYASVHVVMVPTGLRGDRTVDLMSLKEALGHIGAGLDAGDMVVIESTVPPGTCDGLAMPVLSGQSGLSPDQFGLAYCPERTSSGRALTDIQGAYPKVVGGVDTESTRVARLTYGELTDNEVLAVSDATTAECVKLFEGVYRDVNIALANELATLRDDLEVDVIEAIETANTQPFCDIHTPGAGVGGHCIPNYPYFVMKSVGGPTPLLSSAREINDGMPLFVVEKLTQLLTELDTAVRDATVLVLGVTYRPGVPETSNSPALPISDRLSDLGATVYAADPVTTDAPELSATPVDLAEVYSLDLDGVVLVTAHDAFADIDWSQFDPLAMVDGRQALQVDEGRHHVYTVGEG
jgi:UDP-N-acetyl-D-mannosaminuronic acid dehydrogenase